MAEMDFQTQMGYDRAAVMFSPEGRIYQVEYASQAVKLGKTCVGLTFKNGVILAANSPMENLQLISKFSKVAKIDDHLGSSACGITGDSRILIDFLRVQAQINKLSYDEPISIQSLVVNICDTKQMHTQYGGARPYGVSLLLAGIDDHGPQLYTTDPSGSFWGWKAAAIGKEADVVRDFFSDNYKPTLKINAALDLALKGLFRSEDLAGLDIKEKSKTVEIGMIDTTDKIFKILSNDEVEEKLTALKPA